MDRVESLSPAREDVRAVLIIIIIIVVVFAILCLVCVVVVLANQSTTGSVNPEAILCARCGIWTRRRNVGQWKWKWTVTLMLLLLLLMMMMVAIDDDPPTGPYLPYLDEAYGNTPPRSCRAI